MARHSRAVGYVASQRSPQDTRTNRVKCVTLLPAASHRCHSTGVSLECLQKGISEAVSGETHFGTATDGASITILTSFERP